MASEIAIKDGNARALRGMMKQIEDLNAQLRGAVNALALAYDVPGHWQIDTDRMVFMEPVQPDPQGVMVAPLEDDE